MVVDAQNNLLFNFKLKNLGGKYSPLELAVVLKHKFLKRIATGKILGEVEKEIKLNLKVKSLFKGELCVDEFPTMFVFDVELCFCPLLLPLADDYDSEATIENQASLVGSNGRCICGEEECVCFI